MAKRSILLDNLALQTKEKVKDQAALFIKLKKTKTA